MARALDTTITVFLFVFVLSLPHSIAATEIAYGIAALAWLIRLIAVRRGPQASKLYGSPLDLPILIYWILCGVSASMSPQPVLSWTGMRKVGLIFVVLVVAHNVHTIRRARQLILALLLAGLPNVAYSLYQQTFGVGLRLDNVVPGSVFHRAGLFDRDTLLAVDSRTIRRPADFIAHLRAKPPGEPLRLVVAHPEGLPVSIVIPAEHLPRPASFEELGIRASRARPFRAGSIIRNHVTYAVILQLLVALAFGLWLARLWRLTRTEFLDWPALGLAGLWLVFAVTLFLVLTRAPWLAAIGACLLELWFHARRRWVRALLPLVLVLAVVGSDIALRHMRSVGLFTVEEGSTDYRRLMWRDGLRLIREHPWFGVGMNMIRDRWQEFNLEAYQKWGYRDHFLSTPVQLAVDLGLPAFAAWVVLMAVYWFMLAGMVSRARGQLDRTLYGLVLGIFGAASGFLVTSLVHYNFGDSLVVLLFWFLCGLALTLRRHLLPIPCAQSERSRGTGDSSLRSEG